MRRLALSLGRCCRRRGASAAYATAGPEIRTLHRLLVFVPHAATPEELDVILHGCRAPEQFTAILAALDTRQDWRSMQSVLRYMADQGVPPNSYHYAALIAAMGRARRMDLAKEAFEAAAAAGEADINVWTAMMDAWFVNHQVRNVVSLFDTLPAHGLRPTPATYGILIRAHVAWQQPEEALKAFEAMKADGWPPTAQSLAAVLPACPSPAEAERLLAALPDPGVLRGAVPLWDVLAAKYCQAGELPAAVAVVRRMEAQGCRPDIRLFETLAKGCADRDDGRQAIEVLSLARQRGLAPSAALLSAVVEACAKGGLQAEAFATLGQLEDAELRPTVAAVEAVLRACLDAGDWQRGLALGRRWQGAAPPERVTRLMRRLRKGERGQVSSGGASSSQD